VRLTWYVLDRKEYLASLQELGAGLPRADGPATTRRWPWWQVSGLVEDAARLEIEATAVIPEEAG